MKYRLEERPTIWVLKELLMGNPIKEEMKETLEVVNDRVLTLEIRDDADAILIRLLSEYCLFLVMDTYLKLHYDIMDISTFYYEELLEDIVSEEELMSEVETQLQLLIAEQCKHKEEGAIVLRLEAFRHYRLQTLSVALEEWFLNLPTSRLECLLSASEISELGDERLNNNPMLGRLEDYQVIQLNCAFPEVYLKNARLQAFDLDSLALHLGISIELDEQLLETVQDDWWEYEMIAMMKVFVLMLQTRKIQAFEKDREFVITLQRELKDKCPRLEIEFFEDYES